MKRLWAYVVALDPKDREKVTTAIDDEPEIVNWFTCMPGAIFVVSNLTAAGVADIIRKSTDGRFIVLDANTDRQGWLPDKAWQFLSNPRPPG